ncbi:MAG: MucBP domain-containing protein [Christensenellales bacterium]
MTNAVNQNPSRRAAALLIALLLALSPLMAVTASPADPVSFLLKWNAADGTQRTQMALPVAYAEYPGSYWLYVEQEALSQGAILDLLDNFGQFPGGFSIPSGQPLGNLPFVDAGSALGQNAVTVYGFDGSGNVLATYQLYISLVAPQPEPPAVLPTEAPQPTAPPAATVAIRYVDAATMQDIASPQQQGNLMPGSYEIQAAPADLKPNYTPAGAQAQTVTVDGNGTASPAEVVFLYNYTPPAATVTIRYVDAATMQDIASPQQQGNLMPGSYEIQAAPADLRPNYTPAGAQAQTITVDGNGTASPAEVVFLYNYAPPAASVIIRYLDAATLQDIASPQQQGNLVPGSYEIQAEPADLRPNYTPAGAQAQTVTVDGNGIASPAEVVFLYNYTPPAATVTIRFVDAATMQDIASPQQQGNLVPGSYEIQAAPADLRPNYTPAGAQAQTVTVDGNGTASPAEVVFLYNYTPPAATVTIRYVDAATMQDIASPQQQGNLVPGSYEIQAAPADLRPNYTPAGAQAQTVTVDGNGSASPAEVVFLYNYTPPAATVTIHYVDAATMQDIASPQQQGNLMPGSYEIQAAPADLKPNYTPAGAQAQTVTVDGNGTASPAEVVFLYNYTPPAATVTIRYVDAATMQEIASPQQQGNLAPGSYEVKAAPADLKPNYTPSGAQAQTVTVDGNGTASPAEVVFLYNYTPPAATVTIRYVDAATMQDIASPQQQGNLVPGSYEIQAAPADLRPNYTPAGAQAQTVTVDGNGTASPAEVVFLYNYTPPAATVTIRYVDAATMQEIASPQQQGNLMPGSYEIQAAPADLKPNYTPASAQAQTVTVDGNGTASPAEVVFLYNYAPPAATVTIRYVDAATMQEIASPQQQGNLAPGSYEVKAAPADLKANYTPASAQAQTVTVDGNGTASPAEVVFLYNYTPPAATVTIRYVDAATMQEIASPQQQGNLMPGSYEIQAAPADLKANYTPASAQAQTVTVDGNGTASPAEVVFLYNYAPPAATVTIRYVDAATMQDIASPQQQGNLMPGSYEIQAAPADLKANYTPAGAQAQTVTVDGNGTASPAEVVFLYNYAPPAATVIIRYLDAATMQDIASPQQQGDLAPGSYEVKAAPADLKPNYTPAGAQAQTVTVDGNGIASPAEVVFLYNYAPPAATVTIRYVDAATMQDIASPQQQGNLAPGSYEVKAAPADLKPNYTPAGAQAQTVTVDGNGIASPAEVVFLYNYVPPAATVTIRYVDAATMQDIASPQQQGNLMPGSYEIQAAPAELKPNYTPAGAQAQTVTVDGNGTASPAEVVFLYNYAPPAATVTIRYVDAATMQDIASPQQQGNLMPGSYEIQAAPAELKPNYTPAGAQAQTVTVDGNGTASPAEVVFLYNYAPPAATVTIRYVDAATMQDIASPQQQGNLAPGSYEVKAAPADLKANYTPAGAQAQTVTVDGNGTASPAEVVFLYNYTPPATEVPVTDAPATEPPVTEAPIPDAVINIYYQDEAGLAVADLKQQQLPAGQHSIVAQPANLAQGYELISNESRVVTVDRKGANPPEIVFLYRLKVTPAPVTEVPVTEAPIAPATVSVQYLDESDRPVATAQELLLQPGTHLLVAAPADLAPDYEPLGEQSLSVTVDRQGANPSGVIFRYRYVQPVAQAVDVPVNYVDANNKPVAQQQVLRLSDGTNTVLAEPVGLLPGYELDDEASKFVIVSQSGASPASVSFLYKLTQVPQVSPTPPAVTPSPVPVPKVALVPVLYKDQFGSVFFERSQSCSEGEPTLIQVDLTVIDTARYSLNDAQQKTVTVDAGGLASPSEVVFLFNDAQPNISAPISVNYRDEEGTVLAPPTQQTLRLGLNEVIPAPEAPLQGYALISPSPVQVTLNADGRLSQAEVSFIYRKDAPAPTATPEPTVFPYTLTPLSGYAYPKGEAIRLRSAPRIEDQNIITSLNQQQLVTLTGAVTNDQNELWYTVTYEGQSGFMSANFLRVLTQAEVDAVFGYTPAPTPEVVQTPTSLPTQLPTNAPIDLWAEISKDKVNFRTQPDATTSKTLISQFSKGEKLWVYQQELVEGVLWYRVTAGGKDGYVQSAFVSLYDKASSDAYQQSLPSPVPEQTAQPTPTPEPTATPLPPTTTPLPPSATPVPVTPLPTVTLLPTPAPTPLPPEYKGYALSTQQVALRTGASATDETILATLSAQTLVYIWGQTYVDGVSWDHVDVLVSSQSGYVIDSALRRIDAAEADYQRSLLQPVPTPTPLLTPVPEKVTGFAITLGDNVPMRSYFDTNAQISRLLPNNTVVAVTGQEYSPDASWHVVQYAAQYGFIRADQLRILSAAEAQNYLESLKVTPAIPQITPAPYTQNSLSSYGYVNVDKVRLRKEASTGSAELKMMDKNAFALVLSSSQQPDGIWYQINQGGTQGYVMGKYFTVLPISQLSQYLSSTDYLNANTAGTTGTTGSQSITPVEDFNAGVWQNPSLAQASYEPFNPLGTPTPAVETILTPTLDPNILSEATPTADPLATFQPMGTEVPTKPSSSFPIGWLALGIIGVLGGGGYYAYRMYQENQRRATQRAAQRRQQAQAPGLQQARPATQAPYTRPVGQPGQAQANAQQRPPQPGSSQGAEQTSAYTPPRPGAGGTAVFPPAASGQAPPVTPQGTTAYRPAAPAQMPPAMPQGTTTYRPVAPGQTPPAAPQGTTAYKPSASAQGTQQLQKPETKPAQGELSGQRRRRTNRRG